MGVTQPRKGGIHPPAASRLSWRLRDPNVRVTVAGENKDGIDGHRHGTRLLERDISDVLCSLTRHRCRKSRR
jgi:hypothetical protein